MAFSLITIGTEVIVTITEKMEDVMTEQKKKTQKGMGDGEVFGRLQETHLDLVTQMSVERAGRGPQLKGIIHEVAYSTRRNLSPEAVLRGERAQLTANPSAKCVDVVVRKGGKVVERLQLKDAISTSGQRDIRQRVANGQYNSARLVGTEETTLAWNATPGNTRRMTSSGISSRRTTRGADNAGANVPDRNLLTSNLDDIASSALGAGKVGVVIGTVSGLVEHSSAYAEGEIDGVEYAGRVVGQGVRGGAKAACKTGVALLVKEGGKRAAKAAGSQSMRRLAGSNAGTAVAFGIVDQVGDTVRWLDGRIDGTEYVRTTAGNVGSVGGGIGGTSLGASIGSAICPGIGTVLGGMAGGLLGSLFGTAAGRGLFS